MSPPIFRLLSCSLLTLASGTATVQAEEPSFTRDVRPILSNFCYGCHGPDEKGRKGGLQLDDRDAALKGGKSGDPALIPGRPSDSELVKRLLSKDPDEVMPPPSMKKTLTPEQITTLEKWIASGAKYEKHWAFQAPVAPTVPAGASHPIDAFVQEKLKAAGLEPSPEAEKAALLRRVSFDLIGLPPTTEELNAYLADTSPDAYAKAVDRLLAAPQYGERWGRKWLDLARYADTNGYEKDRQRTIWPYRDWVIKALNADMPFDQFTIEQIAGDLLPNATVEQKIATGFHRNTMLNEEGGIDPLEFRFHAMTDRVATTGATWLGLTLQCCQCHTHKYDPIPHKEYYSVMAFLNNADEPEIELPNADQERTLADRATKLDKLLTSLPTKWPVSDDSMTWTSVRPTLTVEPAEQTKILGDTSVLFQAPGPDRSTAKFQLAEAQGKFSHLKVEALTDDSLKGKGPGRTPHGNFVLSELSVTVAGKPVKLVNPSASIEQEGYSVAAAIDGNDATGWAIHAGGKPAHANQSATFAFEQPIEAKGNIEVVVRQQHGSKHTLGRVKLSLGAPAEVGKDKATRQQELMNQSFTNWLAQEQKHTAAWQAIAPVKATSNLPLLTVEPNAIIYASGDITKADTYELEFQQLPPNVTAIRLEALPDERLPARGPGLTYYEGPKGDFFMGEFQLTANGQPVKITKGSESYAKNAFGQAVSAQLAFDGNPETGWSCAEGQGRAHEAVFQLEQPLTTGSLKVKMMFGRHYACSLGKFRISFTTQSGEVLASRVSAEVQPLMLKKQWSDAERQTLMREFLLNAPELANERKEIENLRRPPNVLTSLVLKERPAENPRRTFIHNRGEWTQPTDEVTPGVFGMLNPMPPGAPKNRLGFAKWLVSKENPLTARVVVNRTWATFFGRGIVKTQEDFGLQSDLPTHPELLDFLALRFMEDGWSSKKLHRFIVTSQTYKQSSRSTPVGEEKDRDNKWLWRGPRLRLDAEEVRDAALRAAGILSDKMYGPSVFPPQPTSVTTEGTYGAMKWNTSEGEERYRRTLYTFAKRTAPFAFATTFDAPTGEACIVSRDKSNTPLQALTLLNDVTITEAAQALGKWTAASPGTPAEQASAAFVRCFSRTPAAAELEMIVGFYQKQHARFSQSAESAKNVAGNGPAESVVTRAAWTAVARALMNMDEFVTKS